MAGADKNTTGGPTRQRGSRDWEQELRTYERNAGLDPEQLEQLWLPSGTRHLGYVIHSEDEFIDFIVRANEERQTEPPRVRAWAGGRHFSLSWGGGAPTERDTMGSKEEPDRAVELCKEYAEPFEVQPTKPRTARKAPVRFEDSIATIEEIERLKKQRRA